MFKSIDQRRHHSTEVNWAEGLQFAGILLTFLGSLWCLSVLGGAA